MIHCLKDIKCHPAFKLLRVVTIVLCYAAFEYKVLIIVLLFEGGPQNQCNLDENKFKERSKILKRYLDCDGTLEVQALLALQYLMHR